MITGCAAAIIAVYPVLLLIASGSVLGVLLGFLIAMPLVQAAMYGPLAAFTTEIFATGNRYTGASWAISCPPPSVAASPHSSPPPSSPEPPPAMDCCGSPSSPPPPR